MQHEPGTINALGDVATARSAAPNGTRLSERLFETIVALAPTQTHLRFERDHYVQEWLSVDAGSYLRTPRRRRDAQPLRSKIVAQLFGAAVGRVGGVGAVVCLAFEQACPLRAVDGATA
jgi:hypothetical protein